MTTTGSCGGGTYIVEARRMPFADQDAPRASGAEAFMASIRNAVETVVRGNPVFGSLVPAGEGANSGDANDDDDANIALRRYFMTTVDRMVREMDDLEGTYCTTIDRMEQIREEEGSDDDDGDDADARRPAVAMKFDDTGRLLGVGTFPQPHGYHEAPSRGGGGRCR